MKPMRRPAAAMAFLFGCSAAAAVPANVATALPQTMGLAGGKWHSVLTISSAEMVPAAGHGSVQPEAEAALKAKVGQTFEANDCMGGARTDGALVLPGIHISAGCSYEDAAAEGGRMRLKAQCGDPVKGFRADFEVEARYTPATMDATLSTTATSPEGGYVARVALTIQSRRTGECTGG